MSYVGRRAVQLSGVAADEHVFNPVPVQDLDDPTTRHSRIAPSSLPASR
jgi:hypothetical protein